MNVDKFNNKNQNNEKVRNCSIGAESISNWVKFVNSNL